MHRGKKKSQFEGHQPFPFENSQRSLEEHVQKNINDFDDQVDNKKAHSDIIQTNLPGPKPITTYPIRPEDHSLSPSISQGNRSNSPSNLARSKHSNFQQRADNAQFSNNSNLDESQTDYLVSAEMPIPMSVRMPRASEPHLSLFQLNNNTPSSSHRSTEPNGPLHQDTEESLHEFTVDGPKGLHDSLQRKFSYKKSEDSVKTPIHFYVSRH